MSLSITDQIRALQELASVDALLKTTDDDLSAERLRLATLTGNLAALEEKLAAQRASMEVAERARSENHQEARSMMGQIDHSREKLNRSRNEREQQAAQRELEELRRLLRDREIDQERRSTEIAQIEGEITSTEREAEALRAELGEQEGAIRDRLSHLEADAAAKRAEREAISAKLPPQLFRRYDLLRSRRGSGAASTTTGTCKACNISLPPQLFAKLRREPCIEQCPSCQRILFYVPPAPAPTPEP